MASAREPGARQTVFAGVQFAQLALHLLARQAKEPLALVATEPLVEELLELFAAGRARPTDLVLKATAQRRAQPKHELPFSLVLVG